jgi:hypothetical protein
MMLRPSMAVVVVLMRSDSPRTALRVPKMRAISATGSLFRKRPHMERLSELGNFGQGRQLRASAMIAQKESPAGQGGAPL